MSTRSTISLLLVASLLGATVDCNSAPTPRPRRPEVEPRRAVRTRPRTPAPPAPRGPDVSKAVTLTFEVDGLARLDKRIIAVLPPLFARLSRGQALQRMLPGIARDLRLNALALDALDHSRPSAFAVIVKRKKLPYKSLKMQLLAALPIKGDGKLVIEAIKASYASTTAAPWGGLEIHRYGKTAAWVRVYKGWVIIAPSAPLLDSAHRYLVPRARKVKAGRIRAHLNVEALVREIKPFVSEGWRVLGPNLGRVFGSALGRWMSHHVADFEKIGETLASLKTLSLEIQAQPKQWRWRLDATPKKGGPLARWIAKQKVGAGFGLDVLPTGAFVAVSDWIAPELRSLVFRLVSSFTSTQLDRIAERLPIQVKQRGLFKRKRAASLVLYRKTLRDLNLQDYRASHKVYLTLFHVHAFRRHLTKALPPLLKTKTGKIAGALYVTPGPGLGMASVSAITDRRRHLRQYKNALWGTLKSLNRLSRAAWKLMPKADRRLLGQRPFFQFIFRQTATRVGRIPVSAVALRIKWPRKPRGKLTYSQNRALKSLAQYRSIIETVLGTGDLTWAWAYVGKRVLVSAGRDWKPRILGMVKAATAKAKPASTLSGDPIFGVARKKPTDGTRLGLLLFSSTRLVAALMRGLFKFVPKAGRSMELRILNQMIQRDAKQAKTGTLLEVLRRRGGYRIQSVLPTADVRSLLMSLGYMMFATTGRSSRKHPMTKPATIPVPKPHHP